ncbi:MAG: type II toxin-antitoxin system VapC family toxin [Sphaerospermopsis kisseleviana]|uniref:PilT domain-containing protein n=2 Tax=Sphaerospermopsis TaxID=752201 RepID=A0A480A134_9CYAN|nr:MULTISPECIES: type II toxin-antitoxin system VapC family toxin [Sphaerospermopsis]MBD2135658.1 type II toxin-antitoxin system VapC family toxin [Sphaerospermopsis sp. FACHB-1094]MBD2145184.1 type II toxin-antitoxin system VapC family toxin [Sphaerospermopsis sp. FACHB-1194]GCL38619.1 PilT domain-containing protein [Sphaerospermopsis reniformis]
MNGDSYLLDTNAVVAVLQGNTQLLQILQNADWIGISVISQIEFLAFSGLSELDYQLFQEFIQRVEVVGLSAKDTLLIDNIIKIRQQYRLKLPDAVITATAIQNTASLVTADQELIKIPILTVITW